MAPFTLLVTIELLSILYCSYMAVSGIPDEETDHASKMADFALDMLSAIPQLRAMKGEPFMKGLQLRIGSYHIERVFCFVSYIIFCFQG